ncbi:MAG: esterase/lipase family protein [Thermocrispum sp.]
MEVSMRRKGIRSGILAAALAALLSTSTVATAPVASASHHNPVIFVHGWLGADWNWAVYENWFYDAGWERLYAWQYDWSQSNVSTAYQLRDMVNRVRSETGASKVDLVTHSMGGLSSRYYIRFLGGGTHVDDWVSIAGPNHGTNVAYACWTSSCYDMRYRSDFLTNLNNGDETPGSVNYGTFRSWCDEIINPDSSTSLAGAWNQTVGCWEHAAVLASWNTFEGVRDFIW